MIFIVDDDPSVRTSLTRLMRSAGYDARAFDGVEAYLEGYRGGDGSAANCVILDLHMPGMGGLELQEELNRLEAPPPVIVLSASEDADMRARAAAAGAARVLRKPCDPSALLRAVAEVIGHSPPRPPA